MALDYTDDLRQNLDTRAGLARSIYGPRGRAPTREDGYQARRDQHNLTQGENRLELMDSLIFQVFRCYRI